MNTDNRYIQIHPNDNVFVALTDLRAGETVGGIELKGDIPFGHKFAVRDLREGENVIKYGSPIGHTTAPVSKGEWIHTHNLKTNLSGHIEYTYAPVVYPQPEPRKLTFEGYLRKNGTAGTRNEIWIVPTVGCVNTTAQTIVKEANARFAGRTDGIFAFPHNMGCSQMTDDQTRTQKLLAGLVNHPNAGGVLVLSLGCENNNLDAFKPFIGAYDSDRVKFLVTQDESDEVEAALKLIEDLVEYAESFERTTLPVSYLTVGFKCGGSDGFSGITANPLCGKMNDILNADRANTILTEVPEMFGAEQLLMNRAENEKVFGDIVHMINGFKDYYTRYNQTIYENPSPGNKKGGISTLEDKSLGCVQKGGLAPVLGVLDYAECPKRGGLHLLIGPGNDMVSCTSLTASGANLIVFTTGRGTPFGSPVPTVKLATNCRLSERKPDWIDYCAEGANADDFLAFLLNVASGKTRAKNELHGYREISVFRDGVIL